MAYNHVTFVGTESGNWGGCSDGIVDGINNDMRRFILYEDTITVIVDFTNNVVIFQSKKNITTKTLTRKINDDVQAIRLIIEMGGSNCTMKLLNFV